MAQGRRVERVAALLRREVSELLVHGIKDERVHHGMVSVTGVEVAGDLQHCKIFVSVLGSDEDRQQVLAGLKAATPYVKGELGRRLKMRRTPEVMFLLEDELPVAAELFAVKFNDIRNRHRVLYGSDVNGRSFASQLGRVLGADLPLEQKRMILRDNLRNLLLPALRRKGIKT